MAQFKKRKVELNPLNLFVQAIFLMTEVPDVKFFDIRSELFRTIFDFLFLQQQLRRSIFDDKVRSGLSGC